MLAAAFAEADEQLLCIAAVHKVGDKKRSERLLGVGVHRLLVLATKTKKLLSLGQSRRALPRAPRRRARPPQIGARPLAS